MDDRSDRSAPLPLIEVDTVPYSVPPEVVGATVEIRLPVDTGILEVRCGGELVASHRLAATGPVWDPAHRAAAEAIALAPHRRHLSIVEPPPADSSEASPVDRLELGDGDYDIGPVDLARYDLGCGCQGTGA